MNIWKRYSMRVSKNWVKFNKMFTLSPWGWSRGLRRYRCKLCLRTSSVLTKTLLAQLRKAQCRENYVQALIEGLTVRMAALRCRVSTFNYSSQGKTG